MYQYKFKCFIFWSHNDCKMSSSDIWVIALSLLDQRTEICMWVTLWKRILWISKHLNKCRGEGLLIETLFITLKAVGSVLTFMIIFLHFVTKKKNNVERWFRCRRKKIVCHSEQSSVNETYSHLRLNVTVDGSTYIC